MSEEPKRKLTDEELAFLKEQADINKDGVISQEEIETLLNQFHAKQIEDHKTAEILNKISTDGKLSPEMIQHEIKLGESTARYAGYSLAFARAFRYLAFTSDFGEALRPVVNTRIVNSSYAIAFGYCFVDIGWEAYKLKKRNYTTEKGHPMSMTQCIVERTTFQAIASIIVPAVTIHTTVNQFKKVFNKIGKFQKFGPSIAGLAIIPFLPLYLDAPVENFIEKGFERFGPWSVKSHQKHE